MRTPRKIKKYRKRYYLSSWEHDGQYKQIRHKHMIGYYSDEKRMEKQIKRQTSHWRYISETRRELIHTMPKKI